MRALALLALLAAAPAAQAHPESEAAALWTAQEGTSWVVAAGHEPDPLLPGRQWTASLVLAPDAPVAAAAAKVCIVDELVCVIPPQNATAAGDGWSYGTASFYGPDGRPFAWRAGQRLGVQWLLALDDGRTVEFPRGTPLESPDCDGRAVACFETHYLAFDVAPGPPRQAPVAGWLAPVALALAAAAARRP